ncbi:MAG: type II toxin-antitoxin system Phd/YefM family antitoxin [Chloroflexi bacterium]|nr:type II toxin-antitoxin system Phd/YefM family antitoxin [Chloroflexota bacterium]
MGEFELRELVGVYSTARYIKASEFKATCLQLMDEVAETGQEIIITKRGDPVAKLTPYQQPRKTPWGADKGRIHILGDIISPVDVEWEAEGNPDRVLNPDLPPRDA